MKEVNAGHDHAWVGNEAQVSPLLLPCHRCDRVWQAFEGAVCHMALPRKSEGTNGSGSSTSSACPGKLLAEFSQLWDFLTLTTWSDGKKRQTGRLSLSLDAGRLRLSLTDEETGTYASLVGDTLDDLLVEVEVRLRDGQMPWRASGFSKGKRS